MTLVTVFRRRVPGGEELVFGSDSRLSGGQSLDYAQKIFQTGRTDLLIAFAGDTSYAFPLLMQMLRAIEIHNYSVDRRLALGEVKGQALRAFQQTYDAIHSLPHRQKVPSEPDNYFLLGGFDWRTAGFRAWSISFAKNTGFIYRPLKSEFYFFSDNKQAIREARKRTEQLLRKRNRSRSQIDMEPFEVLSMMIAEANYSSIGGAPQLGKAYQHLNTQLFGVLWPGKSSSDVFPHVAGRPLMPGEHSNLPEFDPGNGFYSVRESRRELRIKLLTDIASGLTELTERQ